MEQRRKTRKWPIVLAAIVLALILLIGGTAGYLYLTIVKAPLELDDPRQLAASTPMSPAERFHVSPSERDVRVRFDRGDLWALILDHSGADFLEPINQELAAYKLSVSGCALRIGEEGLQLDLELYYQDLRLVAHVPCSAELNGQMLTLAPEKLILGRIPLPVDFLLAPLKLELELDLPVIREVTSVAFTQDALVLTGRMDQDILALLDSRALFRAAVFSEALDPLLEPLLAQDGTRALHALLAQDPGQVEELYRELFILAEPSLTSAYQNGRSGLTHRFLPGIDFSAVAEAHLAATGENDALWSKLEQFLTLVVYDFNNRTLRLSDGQFLRSRKEFHPRLYLKEEFDALFQTLDPDSFYPILVHAEDGFIRKTPSLNKLAGEKEEFTQSVDRSLTYILGCIFRSPEGRPILIYEQEEHTDGSYTRRIKPVLLTEEEAEALQIPGKFGVWTD